VAAIGQVVESLDREVMRSLGMASPCYLQCNDDAEPGGGSGGVVLVSRSTRFSQLILTVFLAIWFACGNYWVFNVYHKVRDAYVTAIDVSATIVITVHHHHHHHNHDHDSWSS